MVSTYFWWTPMHSHRVKRRIHSAEFKAKVLNECRRPGASVAAVAVANGLNPNIVHKWLRGQGLMRSGLVDPGAAARVTPPVQFLPVSLAKAEQPGALNVPRASSAHGVDFHAEVTR